MSTSPLRPRDDRRDALLLVVGLVAVMWVVEVVDQVLGGRLDRYGIEPHDADGLAGIISAPFLHAGFGHLIGNTIPFLILGAAIALSGLRTVVLVVAIVAVVGGLGTWLVAPSGTDHIGASGLVFGFATYLIARGIFSRRLPHLAVGVIVAALYGTTLVFGVVPEDGISWQGHLFGAIGGVLAARYVDRRQPAGGASQREALGLTP